ncbi:TrbG/VirB9 family P-type conjugative transfer protein [Azospirillum sp. B4]|uniref:TrbG/VirB9 family P-type conjugative transfer protein n=1 Tax=Azospirillum sp. B4 TaxID=95605 RepID=UPI0005CB284D|nr:TrbG/VirB9 family P-type conjugative transfer protein [Azospirillum sp. B4]
MTWWARVAIMAMMGAAAQGVTTAKAQLAPPTGSAVPAKDDPAAAEAALAGAQDKAELESGQQVRPGGQQAGGQQAAGLGLGGAQSGPYQSGQAGGGQAGRGQGGANQGGGQGQKAPPPSTTIDPLAPLGMTQQAWNRPVAAPGQVAPGVRLYYWEPNTVFRVYARPLQQTTIYLPKCEKIVSLSVADPVTYYVAWARMPGAAGLPRPVTLDQIDFQPKCTQCDNNFQVTGESGRTYPFHIEATQLDGKDVTDLQVMIEDPRFCAERSQSVRMDPAAARGMGMTGGGGAGTGSGYGTPAAPFIRAEMPVAGDVPAEDMVDWERFDVVARSEAAWQRIGPRRVGFDGRHIFLDYSHQPAVHFPSIREVRDNIESPVPADIVGVRGDVLRVTARGDLILRDGNDIVCIFLRERRTSKGAATVDDELKVPERPPGGAGR